MDVLTTTVQRVANRLSDQELYALYNLAMARWNVRKHDLAPKLDGLIDRDGMIFERAIDVIADQMHKRISDDIPSPSPEKVAMVSEALRKYRPDLFRGSLDSPVRESFEGPVILKFSDRMPKKAKRYL